MHTIDLLRGEGVPAKATPGSVCLVAVIVAVPILAGSVMAGRYLQNAIVVGIDRQAITTAQGTIDQYEADVAFKEQMEKRQAGVNTKLAEVKSCLGESVQWTPMLMTLVRNLPARMVMSRLSAETRQSRERVFRDNDPNKPVNVTVTRRTLVLDLTGSAGGDYDGVVRAYGERLKRSPVLGPRLENIVHEQKPGELGDETGISYTMSLMFKAGT
ncbi:MAG: hypothetical protein JSW66_09255 [Phycisphaerales bacterium]|nr:MAG: hypothetical protein JSW66_09255 [Phycisphaerales bacterium]